MSSGTGDGGAVSACALASTAAVYTLPTLASAPVRPLASLSGSLVAAGQSLPVPLSGSVACAGGASQLAYELIDMNADGYADLVVTSSCGDPAVGATIWLVYAGGASGFATTAASYALAPAPGAGCATQTALVDVGGDGRPDWVVTSTCNDTSVGTSRWLVYANGASGFAQAATPYALPPGLSTGAFTAMSQAASACTGGQDAPAFAFFDITGDGKPDLVMTQTCSDASIGTSAWSVFAGSGTGVAQTAAPFPLPATPIFTAGAFASPGGALVCSAQVSRPAFGLFDFNGDGKLDLVITEACGDATVGETRWLGYENGGAGFAAQPAALTLPRLGGAASPAFGAFAAGGSCTQGGAQPAYSLVDGNGDGRLDLLVTHDCADAQTGTGYWQLFVNDGAGFASSARHLALPAAIGATYASPIGLTSALSCAAPVRPAAVAAYFPRGLALVVTGDCADGTVGQSRWLLYPASCP